MDAKFTKIISCFREILIKNMIFLKNKNMMRKFEATQFQLQYLMVSPFPEI